MALLRNGTVLNQYPLRQIGGGVHADLSMWNRSERRNSSTAFSPLAGIPYGHLAPSSWLLPVNPGGMSSVNFAEIDIAATGAAVMGAPREGSASFTLDASGSLSGITFADLVFEGNRDTGPEQFDADVMLAVGELKPLVVDLIEAMGGEADEQSEGQEASEAA